MKLDNYGMYKTISKEYLVEEYLIKKRSTIEIGKDLKASHHLILSALQYHGIHKSDRYPDELSLKQTQFIYGTMMGDGCAFLSNSSNDKYRDSGNNNARLKLKHSNDQKEWLFEKFNVLNPPGEKGWTNYTSPKYYSEYDARYKHYNSGWIFETCAHQVFTPVYYLFYQNGSIEGDKKVITMQILSHLENPYSLAVWFMDDGSISYQGFIKKDGSQSCSGIHIATMCFSHEEHLLMQTWFKDFWDLKCTIQNRGKNKKGIEKFALVFHGRENMQKFANIVRPYIIPSMEYKLKGLI